MQSVRLRPRVTGSIATYLFFPPLPLRHAFLFGSESFVFKFSKEPAIPRFTRTGGLRLWGMSSIDPLLDIWVCLEVLFILVWMCPDRSRRIGLGVDLSRKSGISIR